MQLDNPDSLVLDAPGPSQESPPMADVPFTSDFLKTMSARG